MCCHRRQQANLIGVVQANQMVAMKAPLIQDEGQMQGQFVVQSQDGGASAGYIQVNRPALVAMTCDAFVSTDTGTQKRLKSPLGQKRVLPKDDDQQLVELWLDSGCSGSMGPDD
jgi:hypothetical protein